jgi:hypothetical protein
MPRARASCKPRKECSGALRRAPKAPCGVVVANLAGRRAVPRRRNLAWRRVGVMTRGSERPARRLSRRAHAGIVPGSRRARNARLRANDIRRTRAGADGRARRTRRRGDEASVDHGRAGTTDERGPRTSADDGRARTTSADLARGPRARRPAERRANRAPSRAREHQAETKPAERMRASHGPAAHATPRSPRHTPKPTPHPEALRERLHGSRTRSDQLRTTSPRRPPRRPRAPSPKCDPSRPRTPGSGGDGSCRSAPACPPRKRT